MQEEIHFVLVFVVDFTGEEILSDCCEGEERVLADLVAFPDYLNDVLNLLVGYYLKKGVLVDYIEYASAFPVLVNQHVVEFRLVCYVVKESQYEGYEQFFCVFYPVLIRSRVINHLIQKLDYQERDF